MNRFSRWFRSDASSSDGKKRGDWDQQIADLEAEAKRAPLGFKGTPLNRAGDLCLKVGDRNRALEFYGRAIDSLLEDGQPEAARGVAKKIIRVHPGAIRTLCTLTWLDLASQHTATALIHLRDYTEAAKNGSREAIAADQIFQMATVTQDSEFLGEAARSLRALGAKREAGKVHRWVKAGGSPDSFSDDQELAEVCMRAAGGIYAKRVEPGTGEATA
jgi:tetratricopeptide (TPR) repeat protein